MKEEAEGGGGAPGYIFRDVHGTSTGRPVGLHWTPARPGGPAVRGGFSGRSSSGPPPDREERARGSGGREAREGGPLGESPGSGRRPAGRRRGAAGASAGPPRTPPRRFGESVAGRAAPPPALAVAGSTRPGELPAPGALAACPSEPRVSRPSWPGKSRLARETRAPPPFPERALSRRTPRRTPPLREMRVPDV